MVELNCDMFPSRRQAQVPFVSDIAECDEAVSNAEASFLEL